MSRASGGVSGAWPAGARSSQVLHAHLATADVRADEAGLERVGRGRALEGLLGDGGQPEAVLVGVVVARAAGPVALDERRGAEVLQAAARRHQRLAAPFVTGGRVLRGGEGGRDANTLACLHRELCTIFCDKPS